MNTTDLIHTTSAALSEDLGRAVRRDSDLTPAQREALEAVIRAGEAAAALFEREPRPEPKSLGKAVKLEEADDAQRVIVFERTDYGNGSQPLHVADILESEDADALWAAVADRHPNVNAVLVDGEFVDADALTLREAAEAEAV